MEIPFETYDNVIAKKELASHLYKGSLALVIGSGVMKGFGLPLWWELVNRCLKKQAGNTPTTIADIDKKINKDTDTEKLMKAMDSVEKTLGDDYKKHVKTCLYEGIDLNNNVIKQDLLIAIGAMLMGSMRGSVTDVVNFNFDDILEWYLNIHGFRTNVITNIPYLDSGADAKIHHLNGFLPNFLPETSMSNFLIFSKHSMELRMGAVYDLWKEKFRTMLQSKIFLFIGLSGNDPLFGPLLANVAELVAKKRPTGFWIFPHMLDKDDRDYFLDRGIIPICFNSEEEIPPYLLSICQAAAKLSS